MIEEAIILAGGLGTRLRSVVSDRPKCLALVDGRPFLEYLITYLSKKNIRHFIFSLGYKSEMIIEFLNQKFPKLNYSYVTEDEPLGTGGAIKLALGKSKTERVLICNGDTFFKIDLNQLELYHNYYKVTCTVALKPMINFSRYGSVELYADGSIRVFKEKEFREQGLINGGIYLLEKEAILNEPWPDKFSFEKDFLEKMTSENGKIFGNIQDVFFIDIGIPEDYQRAQTEGELLSVVK